jgi:hypothetical protein
LDHFKFLQQQCAISQQRLVFVTLIVLSCNQVLADEDDNRQPSIVRDARAWVNMQGVGDTGIDGWNWYFEFQPRWRDSKRNFDQRLIRPALIYELSEDSSLWFGYANVQGYGKSSSLREHRLWQQYLIKYKVNDYLTIKSQTRTEQRYFVGYSDVGYKIRQKVAFYIPFGKSSDYSALFYEEVHHNFNTTDYGASKGFEQNRFFLGVEWKPQKNLSIETGYLNQYFDNRKQPDQSNHIFSTTIYYQFD